MKKAIAVIDLKSFYSSVECACRHLDMFETPLVCCDPYRSDSSVVMSVTPYLKKVYGVPNVCRKRDLPKIKGMIYARPRMSYYLKMAAEVIRIFRNYVAEEDIHVYSVDESFLNIGPYLSLYQCTADELVERIKKDIHEEYYLAELIKKGVAYHVGYLPNSLRDTIEKAFKNGIIKTIFCTSTLMEGVNLPADNLFVTSTRNGNDPLTPTAFKNLLGRIGRINYSLYGNVYLLVIPNYANADKYKELLTSKVQPQSLSLDQIIKDGEIIEQINKNTYDFGKSEDSQTLRIATNIYINDVKHENPSLLKERINAKSNENSIGNVLTTIKDLDVSDSIDISPDQHISLKDYIAKGGSYPDKRNGRFEHDDVWEFLDTLSDIYKWNKYEFEILKNGNSNSYYATVLSQWMSGLKVKEIVDRSIEDKKKNPYDAMYDRKLRMRVDYIGSKEQKNEIINDTLKTIEQTILFTIANYFREFSKEYKKFHDIKFIPNDWYEYVEFGTDNPVTIALQRNGYVRENAKWINEHSAKLNLIDKTQECKFAPFVLNYDALINCGEKKVEDETRVIKLNVPELFK